MAFSAGRTLVRVNKQVNRALVTDHDPSESSFYLLHVIILVFTRNKNHYHFFSNKTLETDVPVHVNFVFRPVIMSHADKNCETDLSTTWPLLFTLVRSQSWSLI